MSQTDKELVEAIKEEFPPKQRPEIKFGKLRERVKKGELDAKEVLAWYKEQPEQFSKSLITFLKNQILTQKKKKEEKRENKKKGKNEKESKKGKGKGKRRKREQSRRSTKRDRGETKRAPRA